MDNLLTVSKAVIAATHFVIGNAGACFKRGLPIVVAMAVLAFLTNLINGYFALAAELVESFLYAIFAVAWHRYSLLPKAREKSGFALSFGLREIKFGGVIVVVSQIVYIVNSALVAVLPETAAIVAVFIFVVLASSMLVFFYPAIALDQPIDAKHFLHEGLTLIFSFMLGGIVAMLIFIVPTVAAAVIAFGLAAVLGPDTAITVAVAVVNFAALVIIIAITVTSASFLYRDVIGLRGGDAEATSPPPA